MRIRSTKRSIEKAAAAAASAIASALKGSGSDNKNNDKKPVPWTCDACTYKNTFYPQLNLCTMCGDNRPANIKGTLCTMGYDGSVQVQKLFTRRRGYIASI